MPSLKFAEVACIANKNFLKEDLEFYLPEEKLKLCIDPCHAAELINSIETSIAIAIFGTIAIAKATYQLLLLLLLLLR